MRYRAASDALNAMGRTARITAPRRESHNLPQPSTPRESAPRFRRAPCAVLPCNRSPITPPHSLEAVHGGIQGTVLVEALVLAYGSVCDVCVARSRHPDLDVQSLSAARRWKFAPAARNATPVPVLVSIELSFTLGHRPGERRDEAKPRAHSRPQEHERTLWGAIAAATA